MEASPNSIQRRNVVPEIAFFFRLLFVPDAWCLCVFKTNSLLPLNSLELRQTESQKKKTCRKREYSWFNCLAFQNGSKCATDLSWPQFFRFHLDFNSLIKRPSFFFSSTKFFRNKHKISYNLKIEFDLFSFWISWEKNMDSSFVCHLIFFVAYARM